MREDEHGTGRQDDSIAKQTTVKISAPLRPQTKTKTKIQDGKSPGVSRSRTPSHMPAFPPSGTRDYPTASPNSGLRTPDSTFKLSLFERWWPEGWGLAWPGLGVFWENFLLRAFVYLAAMKQRPSAQQQPSSADFLLLEHGVCTVVCATIRRGNAVREVFKNSWKFYSWLWCGRFHRGQFCMNLSPLKRTLVGLPWKKLWLHSPLPLSS